VIVGRGVGARRTVLRHLAHRTPRNAGRAAAHRPLGINIEHELAGVDRIGISRIDWDVVPEPLNLVPYPQVWPDDYHAGRSVGCKEGISDLLTASGS